MTTRSRQFDIRGYNHLALVCADMKKTVDFYDGLLGFKLVKTMEFPDGRGQHFFFRVTDVDGLAFFWFEDGLPAAPGLAGAGWGKVDAQGNAVPGLAGSSARRPSTTSPSACRPTSSTSTVIASARPASR